MSQDDIDSESQRIWNDLGLWWDSSVEDGDSFHKAFVFPTIERFLDLKGGESILDAGCGNGALSRLMSSKGANVMGVDFSSSLIQQARQRSNNIRFEEMSLTNEKQLFDLALNEKFDRIVCSMVLHDMSSIDPFFKSLKLLLKPKGTFIFSIPHPCFNTPATLFEPAGCITIKNYIKSTTSKMCSKPNQPIKQLVFHRPMTEYFNSLIAVGMVMNGFEEPCVDPKESDNLWKMRSEIPPALIARWVFMEN